ncbi:MAG: DUF4159 domain-containing protein [Acidobacteriota bacterium]
MTGRSTILLMAAVLICLGVLHAQRPFKEYPGTEYNVGEIPLPADWSQETEFTFARLMFPGGPLDGYRPRYQGDYHLGLSLWTQDYPRADRHFLEAVRRLTRMDARSVEQVVDIEYQDDIFNWPFVYAVQAGEWGFTEHQGQIMKEYLARGGFFYADDIHGDDEWGQFEDRIHYALPDRPVVDIPNDDAIFNVVYNLDDRYQVPGAAHLDTGMKKDGRVPYWRGIYDDKKRLVVTATYNSDIGDSWEYADDPGYPEKFSALGIRLGINYIVYSMTH